MMTDRVAWQRVVERFLGELSWSGVWRQELADLKRDAANERSYTEQLIRLGAVSAVAAVLGAGAVLAGLIIWTGPTVSYEGAAFAAGAALLFGARCALRVARPKPPVLVSRLGRAMGADRTGQDRRSAVRDLGKKVSTAPSLVDDESGEDERTVQAPGRDNGAALIERVTAHRRAVGGGLERWINDRSEDRFSDSADEPSRTPRSRAAFVLGAGLIIGGLLGACLPARASRARTASERSRRSAV